MTSTSENLETPQLTRIQAASAIERRKIENLLRRMEEGEA
jgi:hypothetical protein